MNTDLLVERLVELLVAGDRAGARQLVETEAAPVLEPEDLIIDLFWPVYEVLQRFERSDHLTRLSSRMATRMLRVLVDRASVALLSRPRLNIGKRVFAICGEAEGEELGAQMAVDLLEARGYSVQFAGGGVPFDEVLNHVQTARPDVLLAFCALPQDLPEIRRAIDTLNEINAVPNLQIVVGGGVFSRAEGLAEEIGADLWASDPLDLVEEMTHNGDRRAAPDQRTVGRTRAGRLAA